mgnify:CR=1 FL=1
MSLAGWQVWVVIIGLGAGTFLIRLSFLGLIGDRALPEWVLRHLRYTPVAVLPGLTAPLLLWPGGVDATADAPRLVAAAVTVLAGVLTRSMMTSMVIGALVLALAMWVLGPAG